MPCAAWSRSTTASTRGDGGRRGAAPRRHGGQRLLRHRGPLGRHPSRCPRRCATPCSPAWPGSTRRRSERSRWWRSQGPRAETGLLVELLAHGLTAIDEPLDRGLLRLVDGEVVFRHELARLTVADEVPVGRAVTSTGGCSRALHRARGRPCRAGAPRRGGRRRGCRARVRAGGGGPRGRAGAHQEAVRAVPPGAAPRRPAGRRRSVPSCCGRSATSATSPCASTRRSTATARGPRHLGRRR